MTISSLTSLLLLAYNHPFHNLVAHIMCHNLNLPCLSTVTSLLRVNATQIKRTVPLSWLTLDFMLV